MKVFNFRRFNLKELIIPNHVGIILDGNGRWAKKRQLERTDGHKRGVDAVVRTIRCAKNLGIKILSVYAFSTENWKRSESEICAIFNILENAILEHESEIISNNIKISTMGDLTKLPNNLQTKINDIKEKTKNNTGLIFNIGINYGARDEIIRAVNSCIEKYKQVSKNEFEQELYTKDFPDPDIIIRTSGEKRLSNFMLYQAAYSELFFPKKLWPDFNGKFLIKIIKQFNKRERRFGNVN